MSDHTVTHATFSLERVYPVPPERVFNAWAEPEIKARWFSTTSQDYELDFRPGGIERLSATHDGKLIYWESLYREIVTDERIVYTSVLSEQDTVATVSLTSVEFVPEGEGTRLILVEAGAFLDGREQPAWREQGTSDWLDALGTELTERAHS
jgi:uncharacterized protein YndB with AHSA1/START domain